MFKVSKSFKAVVAAMLERRAERDPLFRSKLEQEDKSIEECCEYIAKRAYNSKFNAVDDRDVENWAVHYYDEQGLHFDRAPEGRCVVSGDLNGAESSLNAEEIEEAKQAARDRVIAEEIKAMRSKPGKKQSEKVDPREQLLF